MAIPKARRTTTTRRTSIAKKDLKVVPPNLPKQKKPDSLNNIVEFIGKIINEPSDSQQVLITEYAEKICAPELLSLPVDENRHLIVSKINGYEEEILEKTASSIALCIHSILKDKKSLKDIHGKVAHARAYYPIISLEYPKKTYKTQYQLRRKVIK